MEVPANHQEALYWDTNTMEFKHWNSSEELREASSCLGDKLLWSAFIQMAVKDLLKKPRRNATERHIKEIEELRRTARFFFFSNSEYYTRFRQKAFDLAGVDMRAAVECLRRRYREML
jgi:hypothetical protein